MMKLISEHHSDDNYRTAKVYLDKDIYGVEYIMHDTVVSYRVFPGHSVYMAEDAAENWVTYVMGYEHVTTDY
jgi:hypothetical protein